MSKKSFYKNKHFKRMLLAAGIVGTLGVGAFFSSHKESNNDDVLQKAAAIKLPPKVENPLCCVKYKTDTLQRASSAIMYYLSGKITRNYVEKNNIYKMSLGTFAHEWWHFHNDKLKYRQRNTYTPRQYRNLCMHDEISACLNSLLVFRYEYIGAEDKDAVIEKYKSSRMNGFYFRALAEHKIDPLDNSPQAREAEWRFIANGIKNSWLEVCAKNYSSAHFEMMKRYCLINNGNMHKNKERSRRSYLDVCHKMYTIGGVDFFSYMEKDVDYADERITAIENIHNIKALQQNEKYFTNYIAKELPKICDISGIYQQKALQHILLSGSLIQKLQGINSQKLLEKSELINQSYHGIFSELQKDSEYSHLIDMYPKLSVVQKSSEDDKVKYEDFVRGLYKFDDIDLTQYIEDFSVYEVPYNKSCEDFTIKFRVDEGSILTEAMLDLARAESKFYMIDDKPESVADKKAVKALRRISEEQEIMIPNFTEPVLTAATPNQIAQICEYINYFNSVPDVFKLCNKEEQERYLKLHPNEKIDFTGPAAKMSKTTRDM